MSRFFSLGKHDVDMVRLLIRDVIIVKAFASDHRRSMQDLKRGVNSRSGAHPEIVVNDVSDAGVDDADGGTWDGGGGGGGGGELSLDELKRQQQRRSSWCPEEERKKQEARDSHVHLSVVARRYLPICMLIAIINSPV